MGLIPCAWLLLVLTSTKLVCLASLTVTRACTSSMSFCFSSSSNDMYHLASRVLPARFWIRMKRIWKSRGVQYCYVTSQGPFSSNYFFAFVGNHNINDILSIFYRAIYTRHKPYIWNISIVWNQSVEKQVLCLVESPYLMHFNFFLTSIKSHC